MAHTRSFFFRQCLTSNARTRRHQPSPDAIRELIGGPSSEDHPLVDRRSRREHPKADFEACRSGWRLVNAIGRGGEYTAKSAHEQPRHASFRRSAGRVTLKMSRPPEAGALSA